MGDMGDVFRAMRDEARRERDASLDKASYDLPAKVGHVTFRWVNDYHVHALIGRKVVAQWWPSRGKTMVGQARGKRCATAGEFVALVQEFPQ